MHVHALQFAIPAGACSSFTVVAWETLCHSDTCMTVTLQHILLLQRNVPRAAKFYSEGVGLNLKVLTENWAELQAGSTTVALKHVSRRALPRNPFVARKSSRRGGCSHSSRTAMP